MFDEGHVDAFNVFYRDGALHLDLKEDVTGSHVHHDPADIELHVKSSSLMSIPEGWPGAGDNYYLPQVQDHSLLWPGWDTLGVLDGKAEGVSEQVKLEFTEVEGPGKVHVFATGWAGWEPMLEGGATELTAGAVRDQGFAAHTHANWVFTEPGVYLCDLEIKGEHADGSVSTASTTLRFAIGSDTDPQLALEETWADGAGPEARRASAGGEASASDAGGSEGDGTPGSAPPPEADGDAIDDDTTGLLIGGGIVAGALALVAGVVGVQRSRQRRNREDAWAEQEQER